MRNTIITEPRRWEFCRGEAGPIKRRHQWREVVKDQVRDEDHVKQWFIVHQCDCGDEYSELYEWNNLLALELAVLDDRVEIVELEVP